MKPVLTTFASLAVVAALAVAFAWLALVRRHSLQRSLQCVMRCAAM